MWFAFLATLIDPLVFIPALTSGGLLKRLWQVILAALLIGLVREVALLALDDSHSFDLKSALFAAAAALVFATPILVLRAFHPQRG